ncbi:MAG: ATP-binding protein [Actinomycetota bacterium]
MTIVFCDVTGSTSLGEQLDPETLRKIMGRYFEEMRLALERHGGTVEKFIGDAVMAVFGIPQVHEDDAIRAVRAAAEMREALASLNKELERDWGVTIAARIGVNTGEVVAGDPSAGQVLVTGDAVNVAARLEQSAPSGEILIGPATRRLVRDAATVEPVEPVVLKGKAEPVPAFRLLDVHPFVSGVVRCLDSPMVGRDRELSLLQQAFEWAVAEPTCHLFTVLGTAGVGKSRLVEEFLRAHATDATVLRGRCLHYGEGITFWPVVEVVTQAAGISESDSLAQARAKIADLLEGSGDAAAIADRVAQVAGLALSGAAPEETFWAIRKYLEAISRRGRLIVVFDDVQWGEPTFLDLIEHIADWTRDAPILLVCLARAELLDDRPAWAGGKLNATSILLEPLADERCEVLIGNLLGTTELGEEARGGILEAAGGNPLFVEEMLLMLIDDGLLRREDRRWVPAGDLTHLSVPPTIHALLAARLDRLGPEERAVLERGSVEGKVFHRGAVLALTPEDARTRVSAHLMGLTRKDLIRPESAQLAGEDAFRFRHILIRDAAYGGLPKEVRAQLHEGFAHWLEGAAGERVTEMEEIIGYHLGQAFRYREELGPVDASARELATGAARRFSACGRRALARGDVSGALRLLRRGAELLPTEASERFELLPDLGKAVRESGELQEAEAILTEAMEAGRRLGDRRLEARALIEWNLVATMAHPEITVEDSLRHAERAVRLFEEAGDERGELRARLVVGFQRFVLGRIVEAERESITVLERLGFRGDPEDIGLAVAAVTGFLYFGPTPVPEAVRRTEELLERVERQPVAEAQALRTLPALYAMEGRFEEGRRVAARARTLFEDLGRGVRTATLAFWTGPLEMLAGDPTAAEEIFRESYEALNRMGEKGFLSTIAGDLAEAVYVQGRYEEAGRLADACREAAAAGDIMSQMQWRSLRAKVLARRGTFDEAEPLAHAAVAIIAATDYVNEHAGALGDLAEILHLSGRPGDAMPVLREALDLYERKGNVVSAGHTRSLLERLAGER